MLVFRKPLQGIDRPQMPADIVIVGGGPAGMACALRLSQLIDGHNAKSPDAQLSKENIYVLEKSREIGQHCLSGALLDPRSMHELLPGFEKEAPLDAEVSKEAVYFLTEKGKVKFPITPPPLRDHGNYVISLNRFVKWLGSKVEQTGITIFTGFAGSELLLDGDRVTGVRTDDKGIDKQNHPKSNFEPGYDLQAKIVILADSAGLLDSQRLKGIHLAIKSGMLAAETAFEALKKQDFSAATLSDYQKRVESSWIKDELWKVRNFHQGFEHGFWRGMLHAGLQQVTGGRGLRDRYPSTPGYQRMKKLAVLPADGGDEAHLLGDAKGDGKLTFDKLTDLYHSGTKHEEDQPAHLIIQDTDV